MAKNNPSRIKIAPELIPALWKYAEDRSYTLSEGLNELIRIGLASSPDDAVIDTMKKQAYRDVHTYYSKRLAAAMIEVSADLERTFSFQIQDKQGK
jgi:hypothetical protein